jgi:hypothetical protein
VQRLEHAESRQALERDAALHRPPEQMGQPVRHRTRSRADVIAKYRAWIVTQPERMKALDELRGRDLVCFCAPASCHGDLLLRLANGWREDMIAWWRARAPRVMLPSCRRTRKVNGFAVPVHGRLLTSAPVTVREPPASLGAIPLVVSGSSQELADANLDVQRSGCRLRIQPRGASRQGRRTGGAAAPWRNLRAGRRPAGKRLRHSDQGPPATRPSAAGDPPTSANSSTTHGDSRISASS